MAPMMEAVVPYGVYPGETFTAQTPSGPVEVTVPAGYQAGQKIQFKVPVGGQGAAPTIWGSSYPAQPQPAVVQGRVVHAADKQYRVDPMTTDASNIPLLMGLPEAQQVSKLQEVRKGAQLSQEMPAFPEYRKYRDVFWIAPFLLLAMAMLGASIYYSGAVWSRIEEEDVDKFPSLASLLASGLVAGFVSTATAYVFLAAAERYPECVVWTSLLFGPTSLVIIGILLLGLGAVVPGLILVFIGIVYIPCVFVCYMPFIPFMIKLVKAVASVTNQNPMIVGVALLGSMSAIAWTILCAITFAGVYIQQEGQINSQSRGAQYVLMFLAAIIFYWGAQVAYNISHVTYCGVFGRWYFKKNQAMPLTESLRVALTTSFGSISFGSFLIAAVRALELVVNQAKRDAAEEGNFVTMILLCVVEAIISCLGDILEYFSEWAYVQCAVRGASFLEAAKITYSLCTCSSLQYVMQDLLVNSVVNLGALVCGGAGAGAGAAVGAAMGGRAKIIAGALMGLWAGILSGAAAIGVISSGTKTILALWAEDSEPLRQTHPEIHEEFETRIVSKME